MATNRDSQTFLLKIKEKYPQYAKYDDATLISKIKEKYPQYSDITPDSIPTSESLLNRATGGLKNAGINLAIGGIPSAVNPTSRPEEALPLIAQAGTDYAFNLSPQGRVMGVIPGVKYGATVGATTLAEGARQGAKSLRGEGGDIGEVGKTALTTAGIEGLFRGGENILFKSQIGKQLVSGAKINLGKQIGRLSEFVDKNPGLKVMRDDLLGYIDSAIQNIPNIGPQSNALKKMRNFVVGLPEEIAPKELANIENAYGSISQFNPMKAGSIPNKVANVGAKDVRGHVSGLLDTLGEYADVPIKEASKEAHLAQKFYPQGKKSGLVDKIGDVAKKSILPFVVGGAYGQKEGNALSGLGAGLLTMAGQSNALRDVLFKGLVKSGASKVSKLGIKRMKKIRLGIFIVTYALELTHQPTQRFAVILAR